MTSSYSEKLLFDDFTNVLWPQRALDRSVPFYKHLYKNKTHTVTYTSSHVEQVNILVSLGQRHITTQTGFDIMHSYYTCLNIYLSRNRTNGALLHFIVQIAHCLVDGSHCRTIASFPGPAQLAVHLRGESLGTRLVERSENKMQSLYWHHGNECMLRIIIITFENR